MLDKAMEERLLDKSLFLTVLPLIKMQSDKSSDRLRRIMAMRLGHETGTKQKWVHIAEQIHSFLDPEETISDTYCKYLYVKGLNKARDIMRNGGLL